MSTKSLGQIAHEARLDADAANIAWEDLPDWVRDACELMAQAVAAHERERCAKMADEYATWGGSNFHAWFTKLAAAIREAK